MYDTLMQMGRWFGYRPGYLDLCRLFTTEDLRGWYRHIALAEIELRREFDRMKAAGLTPRRNGLRVREHPGGLLVTAMNKMAHAQTQRLSYAGQLVQTAHFVTAPKVVQNNVAVVERFLGALPARKAVLGRNEETAAWLWEDVKPTQLLNVLLTDFSVASEGWRLQKPELMEFIRRQAEAGELTSWTVALINTRGAGGATVSLAGCAAGIAERKPEDGTWPPGAPPAVYATRNANIQSPAHQALDLGEMQLTEAVLADLLAKRVEEGGGPLFPPDEEAVLRQCSVENATLATAAERITLIRKPPAEGDSSRTRVNGEVARNLRLKTHGLLLIYPVVPTEDRWPTDANKPFMGLAFSFPSSHTARAVDYKVNKVWQSTFGDEEYED